MERLLQEVLESDAIAQAFLPEEIEKARLAFNPLHALVDKFRSSLKVRVPYFFFVDPTVD